MHRLRNDTIGPYNENAGDVALKLEQTVIDWMPETLYKKRVSPLEVQVRLKMALQSGADSSGTTKALEM